MPPTGREVGIEVDPRACGVDIGLLFFKYTDVGGSPRMRGRQLLLAGVDLLQGWIPAHAG